MLTPNFIAKITCADVPPNFERKVCDILRGNFSSKLNNARCANYCAANIEVEVAVAINTFLGSNAVKHRLAVPIKPSAYHRVVASAISKELSICRMIITQAVVQHAAGKLLQVLKVLKVDGSYKIWLIYMGWSLGVEWLPKLPNVKAPVSTQRK